MGKIRYSPKSVILYAGKLFHYLLTKSGNNMDISEDTSDIRFKKNVIHILKVFKKAILSPKMALLA